MIAVVLDCNVLLVSIARKSKYHPIFKAIRTEQIQLIVSNEIISEYVEVIGNKTTTEIAANIAEMILSSKSTIYAEPYYRFNLIIQDADDNKYTDAAISSNADYLVSNDAHFNVLKQLDFPKVNILNAEEFLNLIEKEFSE
jgi:putative PIN family toxin of toxin-antitoxin system